MTDEETNRAPLARSCSGAVCGVGSGALNPRRPDDLGAAVRKRWNEFYFFSIHRLKREVRRKFIFTLQAIETHKIHFLKES